MTRWIVAVVVVLAAGCNKPEAGDCRKAIRNMQRLLGTDKMHSAQNIEGAVRSCRGASKKASVECAIQAQTREQLQACDFMKELKIEVVEDVPAPPPAPGSGTGTGTGSAPAPGSGTAGSGTGS